MIVLSLGIFWIGALALGCMDGRRPGARALACAVMAAGFAATAWLAATVLRDGPLSVNAGGWPTGVGITLRADALGVSFATVSSFVLLMALLYEASAGVRTRSFPALVLAVATGLTGLFLTSDAFSFYVFFEISMIAAYVLAGYGGRARQLRSATIFSIVNLIGSVFFLVGIVSLYHVTGTLDMATIAARVDPAGANSLALIATMIFVAFSIKLGLFPFHPWLPPVYTGTRAAVAAILSGALANIGAYGLLRFGASLLPEQLGLAAPVLGGLGAVSILYGGLQAISRQTVTEVLAYSAIGQVGYVLIALAIGGPAGFAAAILLALLNAVGKPLLFLSAPTRGWLLGIPFAVGAFSVAGVPPAAGFWGKAALVRTALTVDRDWLRIALVALVVAGGLISFVYMFQAYQREYWEAEETGPRSAFGRRLVVAVLAITVIVLGVWPEPALWVSEQGAAVLLGGLP